jgi:hypothetical protein
MLEIERKKKERVLQTFGAFAKKVAKRCILAFPFYLSACLPAKLENNPRDCFEI